MKQKKSFSIEDYDYSAYPLYSSPNSKVYKAVNQRNGSTVVFKVYPEAVLADPNKQKQLNQELNILWHLNGNLNILQVISQHAKESKVFIVSEYCQNGTLYEQVKRSGKLTEDSAIKNIRQIINGYKSIYSSQIIHRNLQAANILIKKQELKIADFSDAILISEASLASKRQQIAGQLHYQAPQTLTNYRYSTKSDIYAIGVLFYFMLRGQVPYTGLNKKQVRQNIEKQPIGTKIAPSWQSKTKMFLTKALAFNQSERMNIQQLINFDFGLLQHFMQNQLSNLQESQYLLGQTQNLYKEDQWKQMQPFKIFDLGVSKNVSRVDIKASEMDIGRTTINQISIVIPSGVDMRTFKSIGLSQQPENRKNQHKNTIQQVAQIPSPERQSEKLSTQLVRKSVRRSSFRQRFAQRVQKNEGALPKNVQNFQKLQVKIDKSTSDNLISSKNYGPITAKGRQNIKAGINKKSTLEQNGIVTNWLLSQIDMVRLLNRLCFRLKKIQPRSQNLLYKELLGLSAAILKQTQDLTLLHPSQATPFRNSPEYDQLKEIIQAYRQRATSQYSFSSYSKLNDLLIQQIDRIYGDIMSSSQLSQNHVKVLDFLVTVWQLQRLLKKRDLKIFYQKSKIQLIVDGQQAEVKIWHLLQLYDRMRLLKLIK